MADRKIADHADGTRVLRRLHELIAALDRRVPRIERVGEVAIARDAATLRKKALDRIAQLESAGGDRIALTCSPDPTRTAAGES
jgi:hypothetical protein